MIKISCSKLEQVKNNPRLYGQMLAIGEGKKGGGQHGMLACIKDTIREVHLGEITAMQGIKELHRRFLRFDETPKNKTRQEKLSEYYHVYHKQFAQKKWDFLHGTKNMNWPVHKEVVLTGHTPWIFKNEDGFIAYYITETAVTGWRNELRFPLIQQYIADKILSCKPKDIKVGYYALDTARFDLKCFYEAAIAKAIEITKNVFGNVYESFKKAEQVFNNKKDSSLDVINEKHKKTKV